jgi:hypothetical protein
VSIANQLLASFGRIAASDGGELSLVSESDAAIRLRYRSGVEADCADGVCALPQDELETMMRDWLARKAPQMRLEIERPVD